MPSDAIEADLVAAVRRRTCSDVVFDLDGTIVALEMPWKVWIDEVLAYIPEAERVSMGELMSTPGAPWGDRLNALVRSGSISVQDIIRVSVNFEREHVSFRRNVPLIGAVRAMADDGLNIHLWTNNVLETAERVLTTLDLLEEFSNIVARDCVTFGKPDPEGWSRIGADPSSSLIVGDSNNDRLAAERLGVPYYHIDFFNNWQGSASEPARERGAR